MEMWIHSARIEGIRVWLSEALRMRVSLTSLDQLNLQLSACGFSLHKNLDKNIIFRVSFNGCFVRQQHGFNVLTLNLTERITRFGGRPHSLMMKCPVASVLQSREKIQCDPDYIQLNWSLCLSDHLIVALDDASLIQMNIEMTGEDITVQGRRKEILSPVQIMENEGEFLALKLVRGQYAYSMEATCPKADQTVLHIFKRRMGLTKRGSHHSEPLTVSDVSVNQTDNFTMDETSDFVALTIPTSQILQTKACVDSERLLQPFYRVDVELTFKEAIHTMHWTMENTLPCIASSAGPPDAASRIATSSPGPVVTGLSALGSAVHEGVTTEGPSFVSVAKLNGRDPLKEEAAGFLSTTDSSHTGAANSRTDVSSSRRSGNPSSGFENKTSLSATEASFLDLLHATANSSAEFLELNATVEAPFTTVDPPEQEHREVSTARGNKDQWIWRN
ncbi:uncharacterized protein C1orf127 homolog [Mugil cephalus]|uniref:uncharacterized protein C1orf127 homolog n=1 Tax=Mugil cephalus TaxID=48193 RepID=UPI001FB676C4|nr:uncharacterized protein C1orf127 homolog [Mugil cephalus]